MDYPVSFLSHHHNCSSSLLWWPCLSGTHHFLSADFTPNVSPYLTMCACVIVNCSLEPCGSWHFVTGEGARQTVLKTESAEPQSSHVQHSFLLIFFSIPPSFCCSGFHSLLNVTPTRPGRILRFYTAQQQHKYWNLKKSSYRAPVAAEEQRKHIMLGSALTPLMTYPHNT